MWRFQDLFRRFLGDQRGNFAIMFALASIPIIVAAGAAVDISRAYVVETRLKAALDAAALAVGGTTGQTNAQLQVIAQNYFNANYPADRMGVPGTVTVAQNGNEVSLTVAASLPTSLMGIAGIDTLDIGARSEVTRMGKKLEVALVLDNTGSMDSGGRMTVLKAAAKNLIDTVSTAALTPGDVKVSIVPFNVDVKVGTSYENANWIKWTEFVSSGGGGGGCSLFQIIFGLCNNNGGGSSSHAGWNGCIMDRDQNYDAQNTLPPATSGGSDATRYPAHENTSYNNNCNMQTIMPLSYNWSALKTHIDNMVPAGYTNTTIGLAWGWNMLTPGAPLSTAASPASNLDKVIVFLTDGDNTRSRWGTSQSTMDSRTSLVCANIKAAGILVYSVRVIDGNATLIRNCATQTSMYYSVNSASELTSVFASIAQSLSNLRISQ
ncbi:pilus assembly protein [Parvibaculum sp.]|jgi:Flp pilus assembly protein TadG|uniref:TadE/TadG family type IV pilus assembly protein n=2 Tax=Parvibaculum sp. TaxID=2024848 RepID=UPI001B129580|nr:pilus assembly protein [Parvibaculum sp.]MBO6677852.1 pilus assembly protein TadG [Parvibaculum sp.]MBO6685467.1 pilus assembly protein TadG [Parvibaculum sp.]MBO6903831.1 pilus assembly protein TadG [Parvibaculum sp.]